MGWLAVPAGPPGPRPDVLLRDVIPQHLPLLVLWGDSDPFTPADGPVGRFFQALPEQRDNTTFTFLPGRLGRGCKRGVWRPAHKTPLGLSCACCACSTGGCLSPPLHAHSC